MLGRKKFPLPLEVLTGLGIKWTQDRLTGEKNQVLITHLQESHIAMVPKAVGESEAHTSPRTRQEGEGPGTSEGKGSNSQEWEE